MRPSALVERLAAGYCQHGPSDWQLTNSGSLLNLRLAVKDLYSVAGYTNAAGSPSWHSSHKPATQTADAVARLLREGAIFDGFTQTDELAYSLAGDNPHYPAIENPKLPGHLCGGSSVGSAAVTAAGYADIGLGTDTGGSIRVPASYCGLYGVRPSHGAVSAAGLIGLAPPFDTVGWFARNASTLASVGEVLLPASLADPAVTLAIDEALLASVDAVLAKQLQQALGRLDPFFDVVKPINLGLDAQFSELAEIFRVLQAKAILEYHGPWLEKYQDTLSSPVKQRVEMAAQVSAAEFAEAQKVRAAFTAHLASELPPDAVLMLPTTPCTAPRRDEDAASLRQRLMKLTAIAGLTGSAQVHLPLLAVQTAASAVTPYGFSLLQRPGNDRALLALVVRVSAGWSQSN